jgi:NAD(P)-dependent dehydrogenase (short-subunit alcohol dehydrogenase family)
MSGVAVVTGRSGGIGTVIVRKLRATGWSLDQAASHRAHRPGMGRPAYVTDSLQELEPRARHGARGDCVGARAHFR